MGRLSDAFRQQITEMKKRQEKTDAEVAAAREELLNALAKLEAAAVDLEEE